MARGNEQAVNSSGVAGISVENPFGIYYNVRILRNRGI
jgi:hypothetical protein